MHGSKYKRTSSSAKHAPVVANSYTIIELIELTIVSHLNSSQVVAAHEWMFHYTYQDVIFIVLLPRKKSNCSSLCIFEQNNVYICRTKK